MSGTHINGHDPEPGHWHPDDVAAAWLYTGTDATDGARDDLPPRDDVPSHGETGAGGDEAVDIFEPGTTVTVPAVRPPAFGRVADYPGALTLIYGHPKTGKGIYSADLAAKYTQAGLNVAVLDYENNPQEWVNRLHWFGADPKRWAYRVPHKLGVDDVSIVALRHVIRDYLELNEIDLLIIDSVLYALSEVGENEYSPKAPMALARAIETFPCPVWGLAHARTSKDGGIFGSNYWRASARMTWHLTNEASEDTYPLRKLVLADSNEGPSGEAYRVHFHTKDGHIRQVTSDPWADPDGD